MTCKSCLYIDHIEQQLDEIKERVHVLEETVKTMELSSAVSNEKVKQWVHTFQLIGTVILTTLLNWLLKWLTKGG